MNNRPCGNSECDGSALCGACLFQHLSVDGNRKKYLSKLGFHGSNSVMPVVVNPGVSEEDKLISEHLELRNDFLHRHSQVLDSDINSAYAKNSWTSFTYKTFKIVVNKITFDFDIFKFDLNIPSLEFRSAGSFSFYRPGTNLKSSWSMYTILSHAMDGNNRSRKVCEEMGLINANGELTNSGKEHSDKSMEIARNAINHVSLQDFKDAYNTSYQKSIFSNTWSSRMKSKLNANQITSIDQVIQYARDNHDSRTAKVLYKLAVAKSLAGVEPNRSNVSNGIKSI